MEKGYYVRIGGGRYEDAWEEIKDNKIYTSKEKAQKVCDEYNKSIDKDYLKSQMIMPFETVENYYRTPFDIFKEKGVSFEDEEFEGQYFGDRWNLENEYRDNIWKNFVSEHPDYDDNAHDADFKIYETIKFKDLWPAIIVEVDIE